jgi:predicted MFS family arabinose efflux permease
MLIAIINLAGFLAFAKVSEIPPIIPLLSVDLKVSYQSLGLLMTAYTVTRLIGSPVIGWLSDKWGPISIVGVGLLFLGIFGVLPTSTTSYGLMVAFIVPLMFGISGISIAGFHAMTKIMPGSKTGLGIGVFDAAVSLGSAGALLFTPILSDRYGWRWTLRLSSFFGFVLLVPLLYTLRQNRGLARANSLDATATVTYHESFLKTAVILLFAAMGLMYFQGYGMFTWIPPYLKDVLHYSSSDVGATSTLLSVLAIPAAIIAGRLGKSFRSMVYVSVSGALISGIGILLLVVRHGWSKEVVAFLIGLMSWGRTQATVPIISLVALTTPRKSAGKALGQAFAIGYAGATLSAYLGGYLITRTQNYELAFVVFAVSTFMAAFVIMQMSRYERLHQG